MIKQSKVNILVISHLYPTIIIKSGYFVYNQIKELSKYVNVSVVVPIEYPMTYRNMFTKNSICKEIQLLKQFKNKQTPNSYEVGEIRPFMKLPGKHFCFAQSMLFRLQNKKYIEKVVNHFKPDIVYAHQIFPSGGIALFIKKKYGIPYIVYEHGADILSKDSGQGFALRNSINFKLSRQIMNNSSFVLTNSERMEYILVKMFGKINVSINHLGTNYYAYKEFKEKENARNSMFSLTSVCYLEERKGIQDNINAVKELVKKGYNITYDIYGSGRYEKRLKKLVDINHLGGHINFKGLLRNEDVIDTLNKYDLFSMPSWEEAFGVVYLEALAAGIPVIGTQNEGPDEINRYGDIIYTVPRSDVNAIVNTIEGLIIDYNSAKDKVMLGQKMLLEEFNWGKNVQSLLKIISGLNLVT